MLKKEDQEKIERYLQGTASEQEVRYVESLFADGESNLSLRHHMHKDWEVNIGNVPTSSATDLERILEQIHTKIGDGEERRGSWSSLLKVYTKVAAILLLPLMAFTAFYFDAARNAGSDAAMDKTIASIYAPFGARASFELPDGTRGTLNSGSRLSYSNPFTRDRGVQLDGEAWFDVAHDREHPFHVAIGDCSVEVLGTSFNVNAYSDADDVEVVLAKGRVNFVTATNEVIPLMPSERLKYSQGIVRKVAADPQQYHAWTEGKLIFRGDAMAEVVRRLERWYHVDIRLADKALEEYSFFATFQDDTLDEVLKFLSMTSPMGYKILPQERMKDGSIKKRQVIIFSTKK
jgi:transmembrane sensor